MLSCTHASLLVCGDWKQGKYGVTRVHPQFNEAYACPMYNIHTWAMASISIDDPPGRHPA